MKKLLRAMALVGGLVLPVLLTALANVPASGAEEGGVVVIPLKGEISQAKFFFLRRALKEAARENARAVVLDMDTYGGELGAAVKMQEALARVKGRTITYIDPNSGSAGALIAVSTREIYMAPMSAIGAAAPVTVGGGEIPATLKEKTVSYYSGYFRSVAEHNGHNPDIAEAFINKEKPVIVAGETVHEKGSLLTLGAQEAVKPAGGKPLLAAGIAESISDLLRQAKLNGPVQRLEPTQFEEAAFWITKLAPLFLLGGIIGAWIEIKTPGFGVPGIVSALCFTIFFAGHYVAGLAGWEAPVVFTLGLILVLGELFVHPGTILPGLLGILLMAGALFWAMVDRYPGGPFLPSSEALEVPLLNLGIAVALAGAAMAILARYLPHTGIYRRLVLADQHPAGPSFSAAHSEFTGLAVGTLGTAVSILRPSGKAEFSGELRDVITMGGFVEQGTPIRVVAVEGSRIVVQPAEPAQPA